MDASEQKADDNEGAPLTVMLSHFFTHRDSLFIQVETTAPPPRKKKRRTFIRCILFIINYFLSVATNYVIVIRDITLEVRS